MNTATLDSLKMELSLKAKNGIDFISAATVVWLIITGIWALLPYAVYDKCVLTFIAGGIMFPLAALFSRILKTQWKIKTNPLQPLGLWLNIAQLFYFPILIVLLVRQPGYFIMTYAVITAAHLFPYAWLYHAKVYAIIPGITVVAITAIALLFKEDQLYLIPMFMSGALMLLAIFIRKSCSRRLSAKPETTG